MTSVSDVADTHTSIKLGGSGEMNKVFFALGVSIAIIGLGKGLATETNNAIQQCVAALW